MSTAVLDRHSTAPVFGGSMARSAPSRHEVFAADATGATALHPVVFRIAAACYALMIATFWVGFVTTGPLAVAMVIVTVCLVAYIGLPWSMAVAARKFNARHGLVEPQEKTFRRFLAGYFETAAGNVSGVEALTLVITVPVSLLIAAISFAIIYNTLA